MKKVLFFSAYLLYVVPAFIFVCAEMFICFLVIPLDYLSMKYGINPEPWFAWCTRTTEWLSGILSKISKRVYDK